MGAFEELIQIKEDLKSLDYNNRASITYLRAQVRNAIKCIMSLDNEMVPVIDNEYIAQIKDDLKLLKQRENPMDGFKDCLDDLIPDLESAINWYFKFYG